LPVPNRLAIEMVLKTALALDCTIAMDSIFHRKNYFYPDLPKGYQISQYGETNPLGYHGRLKIETSSGPKTIRIRRVHLEEDTGKLMHLGDGGSALDFNRAGVPLMEIVTDFPPDIESAEEAKEYLVQLRSILLYLGVCDGKMEHGSLRCEPNISIRPSGSEAFGTKTELKNLSSFRSVQLGIEYERRRQIALLEAGEAVAQETRGWNEATETSYLMRAKEEENDYRYFPDPDLAPMRFDEAFISNLHASLPELPLAKSARYQAELGLSPYDAGVLVADRAWAEFFEAAVAAGGEPKPICNWMNGDLARKLNDSGQTVDPDDVDGRPLSRITPAHLVDLTRLIGDGRITGKVAKDVFQRVFDSGEMPSAVIEREGLTVVQDDEAVRRWAREAIAESPQAVEKIRQGHEAAIGFLVGQVMKKSQGRADPGSVQRALRDALRE
jgi:aspartyl-tRNA(Asn)/glutamyl-tRNA(Gln) amidotransferase subunit B